MQLCCVLGLVLWNLVFPDGKQCFGRTINGVCMILLLMFTLLRIFVATVLTRLLLFAIFYGCLLLFVFFSFSSYIIFSLLLLKYTCSSLHHKHRDMFCHNLRNCPNQSSMMPTCDVRLTFTSVCIFFKLVCNFLKPNDDMWATF